MLEAILDKLGQFPIIQSAFAVVVVIGGLMALRRGDKDKTIPQVPDAMETRIFLDGPVVKALDVLTGIYRELKEMRHEFGESERDTRERHKEHMESMRELFERMKPRRRP